MKYISKSKYMLFKTCPKSLWLFLNKPEEYVKDSSAQKHIDDGKEVGKYAKKYFPKTIDVTSHDKDGNLDYDNMIGLTNRYLMDETVTIAEATFATNGLFCSVDLLTHNEDGYDIVEVKATTKVEKEHYVDAAFQKHVLESRGLKVKEVYILHLDNDYIRHGDIDVIRLFKKENITNHPEFLIALANINNDVVDIKRICKSKKEVRANLSTTCKECPFKTYCHKDVPNPSVLDINSLRGAYDYLNSGVATYEDALTSIDKLNKRQLAQISTFLDKKDVIIDKDALVEFFKNVSYPIYHLDFESIQLPIPPADGTWPYQQIPTQYSLHIEYEDGKLEHKEFLGDSMDPRRAIAESLCKDIPMDVCVLAYNKAFECSGLNELAEAFPDLREHLSAISNNVVDLIIPFKSGSYYHKDMGGSNSIKYVLPALCPNDPELDYHSLPLVHNGGEAMDIYPKMLKASKEEKERIRDGLLKYCCLDTLAMVKVLDVLRKEINKNE